MTVKLELGTHPAGGDACLGCGKCSVSTRNSVACGTHHVAKRIVEPSEQMNEIGVAVLMVNEEIDENADESLYRLGYANQRKNPESQEHG